MKRLAGICFLLVCVLSTYAQLKSPEEFLGYKIGTRFTPHWKLMDYFKSVAAAMPSMVKIEQYGQTNEGRPLIVAYISTPEHISNIESIRSNNLRLAGLGDNTAGTTNTPVIVWLSYNVHGNEPSSSEASMLTLYALVDPTNSQTKKWLQNTLVIIDPCINPDGRDRYVNWYNSIVGKTFNPSTDAREHREPWPQGRTNHYNFDLNRDWAWQTQIETRQRLALYNRWLPQVHVDYHEQGYNNPYYFAPAAQPYHEVITAWQREFQNIIGHNHAKYFDKNGWLYFTKEEFDLLYPSYGDTYPIYNGAIGMTYEQGGIGAGLGILTNYNDTLTLTDRAMHHFTTSLSTLEVSSENATRLVTEFQKFYHNAVTTGAGNYKSYIIKYNQNDAERIQSLLDLLNKNRIQYGNAKSGSLRGFNYDTGKEETVSTNASDIIIPSLQPKSALVKVLFEPKAVLVDSATYDITAWSLPYVYGVKAFASVQKTDFVTYDSPKFSTAINNENNYGYVIRWSGLQSVRLVAQLLQKGIKLRYNEQPFEINGQVFERGAVIVLKTSNQYVPDLWSTVINLANANNVTITPVSSGFVDKGYDFGSSRVRPVKARRVAVVTGEGVNSNAAGEIWYFFDQLINYPATLINANDLSRINWNNYDVVIFPDGNYRYLNDKTTSDQLRSWINNGGNVIALEGAVTQFSKLDFGLQSKKADDTSNSKNIYESLHRYETRERDVIANTTPGSIYKVELDNTHPLAFGYPGYYYTLKQDDNIYEFMKDGGWNVGCIKKDRQVCRFVGSKLQNHFRMAYCLVYRIWARHYYVSG